MTLEDTVREIVKEAYGDDVKITDFKTQHGSEPGENFGSVLTALNMTVKTQNDKKATVNWMAKSLPPSDFIRKAFNVKVVFPKEIDFYQDVITEYSKLLQERHVDIKFENAFPKFIGAKMADRGDIDLIMQNIKTDGYRLGPKSHGVDFEHSTLVMKNLALFHALGIAMKIQKPDIYETKIKKAGRSIKQEKEFLSRFSDQVLDYLEGLPERTKKEIEYLVPRLGKIMKENLVSDLNAMKEGFSPREPFSTLVHNDLWLNNIMFKYENNKPVSVKFIDFQRTKIGSPVSDLMMFLYAGTSLEVIGTKFEELVNIYYDNFVESLGRLGVPERDFKWEKFQEELKNGTENVSLTVSQMRFLFKKGGFDASKFSMESWGGFDDGEACRDRYVGVLKHLARRGWI